MGAKRGTGTGTRRRQDETLFVYTLGQVVLVRSRSLSLSLSVSFWCGQISPRTLMLRTFSAILCTNNNFGRALADKLVVRRTLVRFADFNFRCLDALAALKRAAKGKNRVG